MTLKTPARRKCVATLDRGSAADVLTAFKGRLLPDIVNNYRLLVGAGPELLASARKLSGIMADRHFPCKHNPLISLIRADVLPIEMQTR